MASANDKYHNTVKKLSAIQETYNKLKKKCVTGKKAINKLFCTRGDLKNTYDILDVKVITLEKCRVLKVEKDLLPEHKPVVCYTMLNNLLFMWDLSLKLQQILSSKQIDLWVRGLWLI